jgi:hypothetical protein
MNENTRWKDGLLAGAGAVAGGVVGYFATWWIARQGFYALVLPGAALGLGGGLFVKDRSALRGVLCAVAAVLLGLFTDWRVEPFIADKSLTYYLTHLHQLQPITLIMVGLGAAFGFWLSVGREKLTPSAVPGPGPQGPSAA